VPAANAHSHAIIGARSNFANLSPKLSVAKLNRGNFTSFQLFTFSYVPPVFHSFSMIFSPPKLVGSSPFPPLTRSRGRPETRPPQQHPAATGQFRRQKVQQPGAMEVVGIYCNVGKTIINHIMFDGFYHPFMVIWGMVYYCFTHVTAYANINIMN